MQKPQTVLNRIVEISTVPGEIFLDAFAGSGVGLIVARNLGRPYIGIEKNPETVKLIQEKVNGGSTPLFQGLALQTPQ